MDEIWIVSYILALIILFAVSKEYFDNKRLYENVSWCMADEITGGNRIFDCILSFSFDLQSEYKIKQDERKDIIFILDAFRCYLSDSYFNNRLSKSSKLLRLSKEEYFFLSIQNFLSKNECGTSLNGKEKYVLLSQENYGMWGSQLYDAKYQLTDFGAVYTKLFYYSCLYCENNNRISKLGIFKMSDCIKDRLDSGTIEISCL